MSITRKPMISTELLASRKPFADGIFVVGPFASRVSFSSQQRRAISLVCDIHEDLRRGVDAPGLVNKEVCVVGAGLAGITCAIVAAALGATVNVIEASDELVDAESLTPSQILATIRAASHRDGHPSLNFWPHEDIEPITRLPLLNWFEGSCVTIAEEVNREFSRLRELDGIANRLLGVTNGRKVLGLEERPQGAGSYSKWRLTTDPPALLSHSWNMDYDVVIIASGFGEEKGNCPSYWSAKEDRIEAISRERPQEYQHYVVSGTGDGGLIELLRLLFRGKRAGNIEEEMMKVISGNQFRQRVAKIESDAAKKLTDHVLHSNRPGLSKTAKDEVATFLWDEYFQLTRISDVVRKPLKRNLSRILPLTLLGEWKYPMELSAAPFHRLMLAIAIREGWVEYIETGADTQLDNLREVQLECGLTAPIVDVVAFEAGDDGSTLERRFPNAFYIARHGYNSPLSNIFKKKKDVRQIQRQQALFADQDQLKPEYSKKISKLMGSVDPNDLEAYFIESMPLLRAYFRHRYNLSVHYETGPDEKGLRLSGDAASLVAKPAVPEYILGKKVLNRTNPNPGYHFDGDGGLS